MRFSAWVSLFLFCACANQQRIQDPLLSLAERPAELTVSLSDLRHQVARHILDRFQSDLQERKLNEETLSLRDHAFRFRGKIRPPLEMREVVDIIEESSKHFVFLYQTTLYEGQETAPSRCRLTVTKAGDLVPLIEKTDSKRRRRNEWFESFVIDLDRSLAGASRDLDTEWKLIAKVTSNPG